MQHKNLLTFGTFPKWVWKSTGVLNSVAAKHVVSCSSHLHLQVHNDIYLRTEGNFWSIQGQFPHLMYQFFRGQPCKITLISPKEADICIAFILENIWWKSSPWPLLKKRNTATKSYKGFFVWLFVCFSMIHLKWSPFPEWEYADFLNSLLVFHDLKIQN